MRKIDYEDEFEENYLFFLGCIFFNENIYLKNKKIKDASEKKIYKKPPLE